MPIPRRNFDLGIHPDVERWMLGVAELLMDHRGDAYSKKELREQARGQGFVAIQFPSVLDAALSELIERGAIEQRLVDDNEYYAFKADIDTQSWELISY